MVDHTEALSFGSAAPDYDRYRPTYPEAAVRWAVGAPAPADVVDLGAGTGILTRVLAALGHRVTAVEPDPAMRAQLERATAGVRAVAGSAEALPLSDSGTDAVLAGTAYHWFDRRRAHPEIARLLRPGGTFAPLWNVRDDSVPWVAELSGIAGGPGYGVDDLVRGVTSFGAWFEPPELAEFRHVTRHTPESLVGMIRTRSYYLTADDDRRREVDRRLAELLRDHPDLAGRESFDLPYRTVVFRARRRP